MDDPKWAEGWMQLKPPTPKKKVPCPNQESDYIDVTDMDLGSGVRLEEVDGSV